MQHNVVVVGAGHAGVTAAAALAAGGLRGQVTLVDQQDAQPYHRPPLSKAYLADTADDSTIGLKSAGFYSDQGIRLKLGTKVHRLCRVEKKLELSDGKTVSYDKLIIATGTRNRELPAANAEAAGVCYLRSLQDARTLKRKLPNLTQVVVVGGGFIGLEFSAFARRLNIGVVVIEAGDRLMARAVSPTTSSFFLRAHKSWGSEVRFGSTISSLAVEKGGITSVATNSGHTIRADLVLAGIGVTPNDALASDAGIATDNGILVDAHMQTSDPDIYAVGDCSNHPSRFARVRHRLESVQNANDQARCAANNILGRPTIYQDVPWFWSDQGEHKLQIAGVCDQVTQDITIGHADGGSFSTLRFQDGLLRSVDSVNDAASHMAARRLLQSDARLSIDVADTAGFDLKSWVRSNT